MKTFRDSLEEDLKDPEFKKEWKELKEKKKQICSNCPNKPNKDEKCICKKIYDMFLGKE